ncbi:hypothetical protein GCM10009017_28510 [Halarchaeum rubridurum]|uniref:Uncharacterized protein n=1 Tax=Halarchaeum rubridurum TaxID=489911 RepID=A0A830G645_9EURY|nr:hypothetical protein GCM10009017_28510 [Halarchaeum rubridurum]
MTDCWNSPSYTKALTRPDTDSIDTINSQSKKYIHSNTGGSKQGWASSTDSSTCCGLNKVV